MKVTVDIDDDLAEECAARTPDLTWQQLISDALRFALEQAESSHTRR